MKKPIQLLSVIEKREYLIKIGNKTYWYLMDGALNDNFKYLWNRFPWKGLSFLKKHSSEWKKLSS